MSISPTEKLIHQAVYFGSAHNLKQLPTDQGYEIAFAGRSNAGKSSAINALTRQKALARTSKTPGRTQQIVVFTLDEQRRLMDLPGYGYAKTPKKLKDHWNQVLPEYLGNRNSLQGIVLLMDIRHPLKEFDQQMLDWSQHVGLPVHILLTKADKLSRNEGMKTLFKVQSAIGKDSPHSLQLFSSSKKTGMDQAFEKISEWLELTNE